MSASYVWHGIMLTGVTSKQGWKLASDLWEGMAAQTAQACSMPHRHLPEVAHASHQDHLLDSQSCSSHSWDEEVVCLFPRCGKAAGFLSSELYIRYIRDQVAVR